MWCDSQLFCRLIQSSYLGTQMNMLLNGKKLIEPLLLYDRFHVWTALLALPCGGRIVSHGTPSYPSNLGLASSSGSFFPLEYSTHTCSSGIKIRMRLCVNGSLSCDPTLFSACPSQTPHAQDSFGHTVDQCASPSITFVNTMPFKTAAPWLVQV